MTKHNKDTGKFKSPDIRKFLINYTNAIYKNNDENRLHTLEERARKIFKNTINKKKFTTSLNILKIFNH